MTKNRLPTYLKFKPTKVPDAAARPIIERGGRPLVALVAKHYPVTVSVIVSLDPSGDNGETECHASVASSISGRMFKPKQAWLDQIGRMLGFQDRPVAIQFASSLEGVHIFSRTWKESLLDAEKPAQKS